LDAALAATETVFASWWSLDTTSATTPAPHASAATTRGASAPRVMGRSSRRGGLSASVARVSSASRERSDHGADFVADTRYGAIVEATPAWSDGHRPDGVRLSGSVP
jgi:hypothetical protein